MGFTLVDLQKVAYNNDPFIMAVQARQVFYVQDPCDSRWSVVLQGRTTSISEWIDGSTLDVSEMVIFYEQMPFITGNIRRIMTMQIITIMMKVYGTIFVHNCV